MLRLTKYFATFLIGCSRTTLVTTMLTLGSLFGNIYAANYPTIHYGPNPSYDSMPITPKTWEEVDLNYFSVINGKRYQNTIGLLRPIIWIHKHGMDKVGNTIILSLPEFSINDVKAYVVTIKPTRLDTRGINWSKTDFRPVIGKFKRYALDVRTYIFRDSKGHINHIYATPNHPFYVKNKHGFVAIEDVKDTGVLVGMRSGAGLPLNDGNSIDVKDNDRLDDVVHLVCGKEKHSHCGKPYSDGKHPMAVYNLEVYRKHVFRVGDEGVVVHNCNTRKEIISSIERLNKDKSYLFVFHKGRFLATPFDNPTGLGLYETEKTFETLGYGKTLISGEIYISNKDLFITNKSIFSLEHKFTLKEIGDIARIVKRSFNINRFSYIEPDESNMFYGGVFMNLKNAKAIRNFSIKEARDGLIFDSYIR